MVPKSKGKKLKLLITKGRGSEAQTLGNDQDFTCKECKENFHTGQALGGHMSRVHPGQSTSYANKLKRRDERVFDRELLRLAKIMHAQQVSPDAPLDRVKIRRFKKLIRSAVLAGETEIEGLSLKMNL